MRGGRFRTFCGRPRMRTIPKSKKNEAPWVQVSLKLVKLTSENKKSGAQAHCTPMLKNMRPKPAATVSHLPPPHRHWMESIAIGIWNHFSNSQNEDHDDAMFNDSRNNFALPVLHRMQ